MTHVAQGNPETRLADLEEASLNLQQTVTDRFDLIEHKLREELSKLAGDVGRLTERFDGLARRVLDLEGAIEPPAQPDVEDHQPRKSAPTKKEAAK